MSLYKYIHYTSTLLFFPQMFPWFACKHFYCIFANVNQNAYISPSCCRIAYDFIIMHFARRNTKSLCVNLINAPAIRKRSFLRFDYLHTFASQAPHQASLTASRRLFSVVFIFILHDCVSCVCLHCSFAGVPFEKINN